LCLHLTISNNAKTGQSINLDRSTCRPTKKCLEHCYFRFRTWQTIKENNWESTPNNGPITWDKQQACYARNTELVKLAGNNGYLEYMAADLVQRVKVPALRHCGGGDLIEESVCLVALAADHGLPQYGFSRKPEMIDLLADLCDSLGLPVEKRPFFLGSVDPSTKGEDVEALIEATAKLNGEPTLAYAHLSRAPYRPELVPVHARVVFGYHATGCKTKLGDEKECPATSGQKETCLTCRKCWGQHAC
jgi:hypothetical protein